MTLVYATQLYRPSSQAAFKRLIAGIRVNAELPGIQKSVVFLDGVEPQWQHPNLTWIQLGRRASFADFLELAGSLDLQDPGTQLVFSNTDIVFGPHIINLAQVMKQPTWVACITRREFDGTFPQGIEADQSQDVWMLTGQTFSPFLLDQLRSLFLGIAGCEHIFATSMIAHGFRLWNPCLDCIVSHTDVSPASYPPGGQRYWGLYAYLHPCSIADIGSTDPVIRFEFAQAPQLYRPVTFG